MLERKSQRFLNSYNYFFGGLSEEEQQYRDYFETDLENNPELPDEVLAQLDEEKLAQTGDFHHKKFDFQEDQLQYEAIETVEDVIDKKIFKYKYKIANDDDRTYYRRMDRVMSRFLERAKTRDPSINQNLADLFIEAKNEISPSGLMHQLIETGTIKENMAKTETAKI